MPSHAFPSSSRPSLDREILVLAVPAIGSGFTHLAHHWIDMMWVGLLGDGDVAALAIAGFTVWIYGSLSSLISVGLTALVARYTGAGRYSGARYVASQGLRCAAALSVALAFVGWVAAPSVFHAAGASPYVSTEGAAYVRIFWVGGVAILIQKAADGIFIGQGNTRIPFFIAVAGLALNAALDPLLIFGLGPVPALGVSGAALATVFASGATAALSLVVLWRLGHLAPERPSNDELRLSPSTPLSEPGFLGVDRSIFQRVSRVGMPIALAGALFSLIYIAIARIVVEAGGTAAQAGLGIGHRGEGLAFILCMGYSAAAASLVGRRLGAGQPNEAARAAWRSVLQCGVLCALWGAVLFFLDDPVASLFIAPGEAREFGKSYYRIIALSLAPQAVEIVIEGAFSGAGLTIPPMVVSTTLTLIRIPLSIWAVFHLGLGVEGIWWTIALTSVLRGLVLGVWFSRGTWKSRSV